MKPSNSTILLMLGGDNTVVGTPMVSDGAAVQADWSSTRSRVRNSSISLSVAASIRPSVPKATASSLTLLRVTDILAKGADKSGVKAAIGCRFGHRVSKRPPKPRKPAKKAAPKKAEAPKAEKKAEPKAAPKPKAAVEGRGRTEAGCRRCRRSEKACRVSARRWKRKLHDLPA